MTDTIGNTIRSIHAAAISAQADPVLWVQDYLAEKNGRCSRAYAAAMIERHVTEYAAMQRAHDGYMAETPIGHEYEGE